MTIGKIGKRMDLKYLHELFHLKDRGTGPMLFLHQNLTLIAFFQEGLEEAPQLRGVPYGKAPTLLA